jgi:hypothetical protein
VQPFTDVESVCNLISFACLVAYGGIDCFRCIVLMWAFLQVLLPLLSLSSVGPATAGVVTVIFIVIHGHLQLQVLLPPLPSSLSLVMVMSRWLCVVRRGGCGCGDVVVTLL